MSLVYRLQYCVAVVAVVVAEVVVVVVLVVVVITALTSAATVSARTTDNLHVDMRFFTVIHIIFIYFLSNCVGFCIKWSHMNARNKIKFT
jgi:hypothetical protein